MRHMPNTSPARGIVRATIPLSIAAALVAPGAVLAQSPVPDVSAPPTQGLVGSPAASPIPIGRVSHPTEPTAIVLRMDIGGGFVPLEVALTDLPEFTLYGDGSVVFQQSLPDDFVFGQPMPPLVRTTMNTEQIDALLEFALGPGGLQDARNEYFNPLIADAPRTTFTVDAGGVQKVVAIDALGDGFGGPPEDEVERQRFAQLADVLDSFEEQVAAGNTGPAEAYRPAAYRGILTEAFGELGGAIDWPWTDLAPQDFQGAPDSVARYAALSPEQAAAVVEEPTGSATNLLLTLPDGSLVVALHIRPVLPDEEPVPADFLS